MVLCDPTLHPLGVLFKSDETTYLWDRSRECFLIQFGTVFVPVDLSEVPDVVRALIPLLSSVSLTLRLDPAWFQSCPECGAVDSLHLFAGLDGRTELLRICDCEEEMLFDVLQKG